MTDLSERIARFEHMAEADPDNDMAHFSLGNAYLQAGRAADAARSFERCLELNEEMSKAYQLCGQALIEADEKERAKPILKKGFEVAAQKGDRMPRDAMAELMKSIGVEPPKVESSAPAEASAGGGSFICSRTGRAGRQLPEAPMRGNLGQWILENISAETWRDWIGQGTKVINELRLDFSRDKDQETYDQYMREYLGIDDALFMKIQSGEALENEPARK